MRRRQVGVWIETAGGLLLLAAVAFLFYGRGSDTSNGPAPTATVQWETQGDVAVMFSAPGLAPAAGQVRPPAGALIASLDGAQVSIEAALYDLDLPGVTQALIAAHDRGVRVRVVAEGDNAQGAAFQRLSLAEVPLVSDPRSGLMHHKFVIVDELEVWTGSTNLTWNGLQRNDNNQVRIRSRDMVLNFRREFEEMFVEGRYGPLSASDTPYPAVALADGTRVHVFFSPDDGAARAILRELEATQSSIDLLAFALTADPIARSLLRVADRGVLVRGVVEATRADSVGSDVGALQEAGLDIRLDTNPGNMHHKVMVIDRSVVLTGSYNFSNSAEERNDENLVILYSEDLARQFGAEFERLFEAALR